MPGFLPLSDLTCESGSLALLVDRKGSGRGARCTVSSWRRPCCPSGASCCGGLDVRRCARDKQEDDMADQVTDYFNAHNDDAAVLRRQALEPQDCIVHDARYGCVCSGNPTRHHEFQLKFLFCFFLF